MKKTILKTFLFIGFVFIFSPVWVSGSAFLYECTPACWVVPDPNFAGICTSWDLSNPCIAMKAAMPMLAGLPPTFSSGGVYCTVFDYNGTTGEIFNFATVDMQDNAMPDSCSVSNYCGSDIGFRSNCDPFLDSHFRLAVNASNSYSSTLSEWGGPGIACGGTVILSGVMPMTCCDTGYPSEYGVCPSPKVGAKWLENGLEEITKTLNPGQTSINVDLQYFNEGDVGSVLHVEGCEPSSVSGTQTSNVQQPINCPEAYLEK